MNPAGRTHPTGPAAPAARGAIAGAAGVADTAFPESGIRARNRLAKAVSRWLPANLSELPRSERWRATSDALRRHLEAERSRKERAAERQALESEGQASLFDAAQRHLDKPHQQSFTAEDTQRRQAKRRQAFALRNVVRELTHTPRVHRCGRLQLRNRAIRIVRNGEHAPARYDGIVSCGRVWLCPVCSARLANLRAAELMHVIREHTRAGGAVYLQTFTVSHRYGDNLRELQETVADAFRQLQQGKSWRLAKERYGIVGQVRALEATHGVNGWHPHLHVVWLLDRELSRDERRGMQLHTFRTWRRAVVQLAGAEAKPRIGLCPLDPVRNDDEAAAYVTKMAGDPTPDARPALAAALELTQGRGKSARGGNRTIWEIVAHYGARRNARDAALWREWETAMHGRKQLTWSRGLKARFGIVDLSDLELLARENSAAAPLVDVPVDVWRQVQRRASLQLRILELAEAGDIARLDRVWQRVRRWVRAVRWIPPSQEDTS